MFRIMNLGKLRISLKCHLNDQTYKKGKVDVDNSLIILKHINSKNTKIRVIIRSNMKHV